MSEPIRVDKYTLIRVETSEQYKVKIVEGWEERAGEFKPNFCKRSFKKGCEEKTVPVMVKLGDAKTAAGVLVMILKQITGMDYAVDIGAHKAPNEDVPF